ncbi:hypothetical protein ABTX61_09300 [Amycolatopsis japonica]|uniref:hypothetical protein n=1 Tax=Amycolatopsis japonica TaxID=208439 RepID=UPI003317C8C1
MFLRTRGDQNRFTPAGEGIAAVYVSRDEVRQLKAGEQVVRIAATAGPPQARRLATVIECEPVLQCTIQEVLLGEVTWEERQRASA